jgi:radical SAM superfamily enzyme YgiQ (UPF0313 family)
MRLLFISANRLRGMMVPMPLGLASVIAQVDESRHEIRTLDLMFSDQPEADVKAALSDFDPELVAISIRNIDNQSYLHTKYFLPEVKELIQLCRKHSPASIVIGGAAFTVSPVATFEYLDPDFGVVGEGEIVFRELVERIQDGTDYSDLAGLVWKEADEIRMNPPCHIQDLDTVQPPRRELFDNQRYAAEGGAPNIVIKQGCVFQCLYCDSRHTMGPRWRTKSPERVVDELESIQRDTGANTVFFTDAIFNHPPGHATEICHAILRRKLEIYWVAQLNPAFVDRELLELMHKAGCRVVSVSCDTCSEKMLKVLRKAFTKDQLRDTLDRLEETQIRYVLSILIGGPGEDRQTVEETIDFLKDRTPIMLDFCVGIRLMPHTPLSDIAVQEGIISADDPLMEPRFYISPDVKDWIEEYLNQFCSERPGWTVMHE